MDTKNKRIKRIRRHRRIRDQIKGTSERPRLSVYRSNKHVYVQLIDDASNRTLIGISDKAVQSAGQRIKKEHLTKSQKSRTLGVLLAKKAEEGKIKKVVFDKGGYAYHGRTKAIAQGAREGGLEF